MAYTTINKSSSFMNTKLWEGDGNASRAITGVGFQPDFVWIKNRDTARWHSLFDVIRGTTKSIYSNETNVETTHSTSLLSFDSDGITIGSDLNVNYSGDSIVGWNWKAGGAGSANTDGSINSTVSVNTTAGVSIVKWTGNNGASGTVGHGLGVKPKMIITKGLTYASSWATYHEDITANYWLQLCENDAKADNDTIWNDTEPTSSVFTVGSSNQVNDSYDYIAYCFTDVVGYSKFGSYIGNGVSNSPFIYCGFKPSFIIIKNSNAAQEWVMFDNKRIGYNTGGNEKLYPDLPNVEADITEIDLLSNGFKLRNGGSQTNQSGQTMIYMAFGQSIVGTNDIPVTAR